MRHSVRDNAMGDCEPHKVRPKQNAYSDGHQKACRHRSEISKFELLKAGSEACAHTRNPTGCARRWNEKVLWHDDKNQHKNEPREPKRKVYGSRLDCREIIVGSVIIQGMYQT